MVVSSSSPIQADRRLEKRYPVDVPVQYSVVDGKVARTGYGIAVNLSDNSILFIPEERIPAGLDIQLSLYWPAASDTIELRASGRVVRSGTESCAVSISSSGWVYQAFASTGQS